MSSFSFGRTGTVRKGECSVPGGLTAEEVSQHEKYVGRTFSETTHVIGIPGVAEGHVEAHPVTIGHQAPLQVAPDAVEHLEFESLARDLALIDVAANLANDRFIVGGQRRITAILKEIDRKSVV